MFRVNDKESPIFGFSNKRDEKFNIISSMSVLFSFSLKGGRDIFIRKIKLLINF